MSFATSTDDVVRQVSTIQIYLMHGVQFSQPSRQSYLCLSPYRSVPGICVTFSIQIHSNIRLGFFFHFPRRSSEVKFNQNYFLLKWASLISLSEENGAYRPCRIIRGWWHLSNNTRKKRGWKIIVIRCEYRENCSQLRWSIFFKFLRLLFRSFLLLLMFVFLLCESNGVSNRYCVIEVDDDDLVCSLSMIPLLKSRSFIHSYFFIHHSARSIDLKTVVCVYASSSKSLLINTGS